MIYELLHTDRENTRTGRELASALKVDIRQVTEQIERERRSGQPICALQGKDAGYYLTDNPAELEAYCERLKRRSIELFKTRKALLQTLKKIAEQKGGNA